MDGARDNVRACREVDELARRCHAHDRVDGCRVVADPVALDAVVLDVDDVVESKRLVLRTLPDVVGLPAVHLRKLIEEALGRGIHVDAGRGRLRLACALCKLDFQDEDASSLTCTGRTPGHQS